MILVYTGEGKGKTSAAIGQAIRAYGNGLRVVFAQFMKPEGCAGEQKVLSALPGLRFFAGGAGFFLRENDRPEHRKAALAVLFWVEEQFTAGADMLILDESLYALRAGLLLDAELQGIVAAVEARKSHIVLSGRGLPDWLRAEADTVTEMTLLKHGAAQGRKALRGIEF
jgi:cob(I)alamin adenosyltransferase